MIATAKTLRISDRLTRHGGAIRLAVMVAGAFLAGWIAFNDTSLLDRQNSGATAQGFLVAMLILLLAWRGVTARWHGAAVMSGWYFGATASIPQIWSHFFGPDAHGGLPTWIALSVLLGSAYAIAPRKWPRLGLVTGCALTTVPPLGLVGMASPLLGAGALFPGWGMAAIGLTLAIFFLSGLLLKAADLVVLAALMWGIVHIGQPAPSAPANAWAMITYDGSYPADLMKGFERQDRLKTRVLQAIDQGARLIVLPEGSNPQWDDGAMSYWSDVKNVAIKKRAQVLIGVYTTGLVKNNLKDGLFDLTTGKLYPASIPMPIGMWRPWIHDPFAENFPLRLGETNTLPTLDGTAAYSICYENLLLWPTMVASRNHPKVLISAANQWFAVGRLADAQQRSLEMQARLFGLPLISAVNWPSE